MRHWTKRAFVAFAPLLLTSCLWGPGRFTSDLTVKKDGSFTLDYRGELVLQLPPDARPEPVEGRHGALHDRRRRNRTCTPAEVADQKRMHGESAAKKLKDSEDMAKAFGLPGLDDQSNRAFAAKLMKYAGWQSVTYRGKGVFDVDYHMEGSTREDSCSPRFPTMICSSRLSLFAAGQTDRCWSRRAFTGGSGPMAARAGAAAATR